MERAGSMEPKYTAPLYDDWDPPILLHREKELRCMLGLTVESQMPCNLWVEGAKGLGKTLTCRFFAGEVRARGAGKPFYIQCGTSLNKSIEVACSREGIRLKQRELNPMGFINAILKAFPEEKAYYLILDDPENVKDIRTVDGFIRDAYNTLTNAGKKFAIIVVTRMSMKYAERVMRVLGSDSRLNPYPLVFNSYSVPEITNILEQRLNFAFERSDAWDREALHVIARYIYRVGGDIRDALSILRHAVKIAKDKLTVEDAVEAVEYSKNAWWSSQLRALPPHWAFILYIAAKNAQVKGEVAEVDVATVIAKYKEAARNLEFDPLSKTPTYNALKKMCGIKGLFDLEKIKSGQHESLIMRFEASSVKHIIKVGEAIDWEFILGCS